MLATKNHILIGRHPRISVGITSIKMVRTSPDAVCSVCRWFGCRSGHSAAMSGLATVTYTPVSTVTLCDVVRARSGGALLCTPGFPFFRRSTFVSRRLAIPPGSLFSAVSIQTCFFVGSRMSLRGHSPLFLRRSSFSGSPQLQHADCLWCLRLVGGDRLFRNVLPA